MLLKNTCNGHGHTCNTWVSGGHTKNFIRYPLAELNPKTSNSWRGGNSTRPKTTRLFTKLGRGRVCTRLLRLFGPFSHVRVHDHHTTWSNVMYSCKNFHPLPTSGSASKMASDVRPWLTLNYPLPNMCSHHFHSLGRRHDVGGDHNMLHGRPVKHVNFHPLADLHPKWHQMCGHD